MSKLISKLLINSYGWKHIDSVKRYENNPVLSAKDVPYEASLIFNAGVVKYKGKYLMAFRDDYADKIFKHRLIGTHIGLATSEDGINWKVSDKPFMHQSDVKTAEIKRFYDPRLTIIDDALYMCFAVDTVHGVRGGIGRISEDLTKLEVLSLSTPDNRNMVLFPEKIGGKYYRLERPMPVYSRGGKDTFDIWCSSSNDLKFWGESELVLGTEKVPFANDKIGPAAPPVKTEYGWLTIFHSVIRKPYLGKNGWERQWRKIYMAGVMLLDKQNPSKVLGMCKDPLLWPEAKYELENGFRNNAIFPCGMVLEDDNQLKIYYGAGDIVTCLATADADVLAKECLKQKI